MNLIQPHLHTRRAFLRRSGQLALTGTALPLAINLAAMGEAAAFNAPDYKALVCVFLAGGNDYANTVVTYDQPTYDRYAAARLALTLPRANLAATVLNPTTALPNGRQYALHPAMTGLAGLFNSGKAAVQLNVGPLIAPMTRAQFNNNSVPKPPQLFSHNDQQAVWQSAGNTGSEVTTKGWGGDIGDLALSSNDGSSTFTCMSMSGNAVFLSGDQALAYQVGTNGVSPIKVATSSVHGSTAVQGAIHQLVRASRNHVLENEYNKVTARAMDSQVKLTNTLAQGGMQITDAMFPTDAFGVQLRNVARLIAGRSTSGAKRQVFFVSVGGFDFHDNLLNGHQNLMARLDAALTAFYNATVQLGVADKVTSFTASDFGRTLTSNGDGSDHGWGNHHFVVGGAVKGKAFYGSAPPVSLAGGSATEDQWHVGHGRLLPSTSVNQYAATLARWFGVADTEMGEILPNLRNFGGANYPFNLGFLG